MHTVFEAFESKVREVNLFFKFLETTQQPDVVLRLRGKGKRRSRRIDLDIQRILKATSFLILYNLVEASLRLGVTAIYETIRKDALCYGDVRDEIRTMWLRSRLKELEKDGVGRDRYREVAKELIEKAIAQHAIEIDAQYIPFSGNLDARKVREVAISIGFSSKVQKHLQDGSELLKVKQRRNALAHGDESFATCGGAYTMSELAAIKKQVVVYVRSILRNIRRYLEKEEYRHRHPLPPRGSRPRRTKKPSQPT